MAIDEPLLDLGLTDLADDTPVGLPRALSPSGASTFEQCARRWRFRYIDRLPEPPGEAALVGTFAHRVLELLLAEPAAGRTIERAKAIAREVWPSTRRHPDYRALGLDEAGERAFRWKGWLAVEGLWALEDPATVVVRATERRVRAELGGVPFLGVVDRLDECDDGLVVTDYKSGRPPSARFAADKLGQVLLYAAAITAADGEAPVRARLVYLGADIIEVEATPDAVAGPVAALQRTWDALVTALADDEFAPRPGPLCGWCPHVARCPEGRIEVRRRRDQGRLRDDAPALALVAAHAE
ncbi:MAG TPA: PD-(D/E)XK nuclease family protein [Acidimicrobiales bacterium]|nr:PD-(D/E)XK nuclease family protein [Acidimicrobiales bacterium]